MGSGWMLKYDFNTQPSKMTPWPHFLPMQSQGPAADSAGPPRVFLE